MCFLNVGIFLQLQLKSFLFQQIAIDINSKSEAVFTLFIQYISDMVLTVTSRSDKEFLMIETKAAGGSLSSSSTSMSFTEECCQCREVKLS